MKAGEEEPGLGARHVPHQAAAVRQPDLANRRITVQKYNRHTDPMSLQAPGLLRVELDKILSRSKAVIPSGKFPNDVSSI